MNKRDRLRAMLLGATILGVILIIDELWMFGIGFGPILPDLSQWHLEPFHHWMWGVLLVSIVSYVMIKRRREVM